MGKRGFLQFNTKQNGKILNNDSSIYQKGSGGDFLNYLLTLIEQDLQKLENYNLQLADEKFYERLKNGFENLREKVYRFGKEKEMGLTFYPAGLYHLKIQYARLSAEIDFFMTVQNGKEKVVIAQIEKIRCDLERITYKLNDTNAYEIYQEFENTVHFYEKMKISFLEHPEIKRLRVSFYYQLYKIKIKNNKDGNYYRLFLDENWSFCQPLLKADIDTFLKNEEADEYKKIVLQRYLVNASLLKVNFKVIMDILYSSPYGEIVDFIMEQETTYKNDNIRAEVHSLSSKTFIKNVLASISVLQKDYYYINRICDESLTINKLFLPYVSPSEILYTVRELQELRKEYKMSDIVSEVYRTLFYSFREKKTDKTEMVKQLVQNPPVTYKYLCEYLIVNACRDDSSVNAMDAIIDLRNCIVNLLNNSLYSSSMSCGKFLSAHDSQSILSIFDYEVGCAIIAQAPLILQSDIIKYILVSKDKDLFAYFVQSDFIKIDDFQENQLIEMYKWVRELKNEEKKL